ncbi:hypothetical protein [Halalkalirubrum salinum]|uniref:hypothetical protein n=1 Tax=Halalkalirubrum salinum TaxID=2563889 RepID=UPI0010FB6768|nr:hypothetical protein [Halalkalirubrum salinum]
MNPNDPTLLQIGTAGLAGVVAATALIVAVYGVYYQRTVIEPRFGRFELLGEVSGTFHPATTRSPTDGPATSELWSAHHELTIDLRGYNSGTGPLLIHAITFSTSALERPKELLSEPIRVAPGESIATQFSQEISRERSIEGAISGEVVIRTSGGDIQTSVRITPTT